MNPKIIRSRISESNLYIKLGFFSAVVNTAIPVNISTTKIPPS
jgi:hypothetical protein